MLLQYCYISGESVLKAIKRLGGGGKTTSASQRWAAKRKNKKTEEKKEDKDTEENKAAMLKLTELSNVILISYSTEIYEVCVRYNLVLFFYIYSNIFIYIQIFSIY